MARILDARIRSEHIARYGATEDVEAYLHVLGNLPTVLDSGRGEDHHMLAKSVFPEYADLKAIPWNRLRIHRGVHTALTILQSRFEERLKSAAFLMKGQSNEAFIEMCRRQGKKNVESGLLDRIRSKAGKRTHELYPEMASQWGKISGRKNVESGHILNIATVESCNKGGKKRPKITNCLRWNIRR